MQRKTKIILGSAGLLLIGSAVAIWLHLRRKNNAIYDDNGNIIRYKLTSKKVKMKNIPDIIHDGSKLSKKDFYAKFAPTVQACCAGTPLFPSVALVQCAFESGWGGSGIVKKTNNVFGIKATGSTNQYWHGDKELMRTAEQKKNGEVYYINDYFRKYDNIKYSILDHNRLFLENERYKRVLEAKTPYEQAQAIQDCGYATDTEYAKKLINQIKADNTTQYDPE